MLKFRLLFTLLFLMLGFTVANAQDDADIQKQQFDEPRRPQLLRELGLRQAQIRQIRLINGENKEKLREATFRMREARGNLDAAIYSDNADTSVIETKLREFQNAQAEVAKIRTMTELAIRKVLTPEQLVRFRELRQGFQQTRQNRREIRQERRQNPQKPRLGNGQKPLRQD